MEESKMSLGYQKGNMWVADKVFDHYSRWDTYTALISACRKAEIMFECQFSYSSRKYCASIHTYDKLPSGRYVRTEHANAFHANPLQSIVYALRRHGELTQLLRVLCVEIEIRLLSEKLLPVCSRLGDALEALADTIILTKAKM